MLHLCNAVLLLGDNCQEGVPIKIAQYFCHKPERNKICRSFKTQFKRLSVTYFRLNIDKYPACTPVQMQTDHCVLMGLILGQRASYQPWQRKNTVTTKKLRIQICDRSVGKKPRGYMRGKDNAVLQVCTSKRDQMEKSWINGQKPSFYGRGYHLQNWLLKWERRGACCCTRLQKSPQVLTVYSN